MSDCFHPPIETDFTATALYYAEHASRVIANVFERVLALLALNQTLGAPASGGLRIHSFIASPFAGVSEKRCRRTEIGGCSPKSSATLSTLPFVPVIGGMSIDSLCRIVA